MLLSVCENPKVLEVTRIINIFITIIRIIVPLILIFVLMIKFMGAITKNDQDGLQKVLKMLPKNLIAAAIIFLIPTVVKLVVKVTTSDTSYEKCLEVVSLEEIGASHERIMESLIARAELTESISDYNNANNYLKNIKNEKKRKEYERRLAILKAKIDASHQQGSDYDDEDIPDSENKYGVVCEGEYENGYGLATLSATVEKGVATNYRFLSDGKELQNSSSSTYKAINDYTLLIKPRVEVTVDGEKSLISCKVKHSDNVKFRQKGYYFHVKDGMDSEKLISNPYPSNQLSYFIHFPQDADPDEKLPVILALHGGFGWGALCKGSITPEGLQTHHYLKRVFRYGKDPINNVLNPDVKAIIIAPSNMTCGWESSIFGALDILYAYAKLFNVDFSRIFVTGSSQGGYGTIYSGFLEEQLIFKPKTNMSLNTIAELYGTTPENIKALNKRYDLNISYSNNAQTEVKSGSHFAIRAKTDEDQRSLFALLIPMSPAKNASRCIFTPTTKYDKEGGCKSTPKYELKTPIWVISSNDEYDKIQQFAKELTAYYKDKIEIRYTILTNLKKIKIDSHNTQNAIIGKTRAIDWILDQKYGKVDLNNNSELSDIEKSLGANFAGNFNP